MKLHAMLYTSSVHQYNTHPSQSVLLVKQKYLLVGQDLVFFRFGQHGSCRLFQNLCVWTGGGDGVT